MATRCPICNCFIEDIRAHPHGDPCVGPELDVLSIRYCMSEKHLSGYRLILGFETLEACQAAQAALTHSVGTNNGK